MSQLKALDSCFYIHEDHVSSAAINFCHENGLEGLIFVENDTLEIRPLRSELAPLSLIDDYCVKGEINLSFGKPHLIKTSVQYFDNSNLYLLNNLKRKRRDARIAERKLTIELAVFFDEAAYRTFMPLLDNDVDKIRYMILAYVNRIQAAFHLPSLGVAIDISLVHLEIMQKQPSQLPVVNRDAQNILASFCKYSKTHNPSYDRDPHHWDVALYLTGLNLYRLETMKIVSNYSKSNEKIIKNYQPLGVSKPYAICKTFSCAIAEFRDTKITSSGLRSSLVAVHEISHVLGLQHDNSFVSKSKDRNKFYIMTTNVSKSQSQVIWSEHSYKTVMSIFLLRFKESFSCLRDHVSPTNSAYVFNNLHYHNLPGREWTAKAQCELFLRDKNANVVTLYDICQTLQCEIRHKNTYYFTGPALAGTHCALGMECCGEKCIPVIEPPYIFKYCEDDNWSEWKEDSCKNSYCLEGSKGVRNKRRFCKHQNDITANCIGPYYDVVLCDDSSLCSQKRKTIAEFTTMKCTEFSRIMSELELKPGWQAPHKMDKPWIACTIHCVRKKFSTFYAPRWEMLNFGNNPYFPDGTLCHKTRDQNYYCRFHHCLPENYSLEENWGRHYLHV
ncbi:A disintegrin and metalloproteinase with thrombospondin motifs 2-like isoform X2 [Linepithema humile]